MNTNPTLDISQQQSVSKLAFYHRTKKKSILTRILYAKYLLSRRSEILEDRFYAWIEVKRGREEEGRGWTRSAKHSVMKVGRFAGRSGEKQRKWRQIRVQSDVMDCVARNGEYFTQRDSFLPIYFEPSILFVVPCIVMFELSSSDQSNLFEVTFHIFEVLYVLVTKRLEERLSNYFEEIIIKKEARINSIQAILTNHEYNNKGYRFNRVGSTNLSIEFSQNCYEEPLHRYQFGNHWSKFNRYAKLKIWK